MELQLIRTYGQNGVNGILLVEGKEICKTIELPWQKNKTQISCIPEGLYRLRKRYSKKFGWHFEIPEVKGRTNILIHPANNALKELKGCIAPVVRHTGEGRGTSSKSALQRLKNSLYPVLETGGEIQLTIKNPIL